jgi:solute carrier family 25 thiamine pyrophosphate transporter 19
MAQPGFAPAQSTPASMLAETIVHSSLAVTSPPTPLTPTTTTATKPGPKLVQNNDTSTKKGGITVGTPTLTKAETVFCGSTAGVVSRFVVAPLDVVKIRLQVNNDE